MEGAYAWPKNACEIVAEIDAAHRMGWDPDSVTSILFTFIEEHCDPEAFRAYVQQCAELQGGGDVPA